MKKVKGWIFQLIRYVCVGATGLGIQYLIVHFFTDQGSKPSIAVALGMFIATTSNFFLNRFWTFERKNLAGILRDYLFYWLAGGCGALAAYSLSLLLIYKIDFFAGRPAFASVLATCGGASLNFFLNRKFTFRERAT